MGARPWDPSGTPVSHLQRLGPSAQQEICADEDDDGMDTVVLPAGGVAPRVRGGTPPPIPCGGPSGPQLAGAALAQFLMAPPARGAGPLLCFIERDKSGFGNGQPRYQLRLEAGNSFLLAARKRARAAVSKYVLSCDSCDLSRRGPGCIGKLHSSFLGTQFSIFDCGAKPGKLLPGSSLPGRRELGCVLYERNVLGTKGPRKMTAAIPNQVDPASRQLQVHQRGPSDSLLTRLKCQSGLDELLVLQSKLPKWNDQLGAYCLNFGGRVTEPSVKNFQLVGAADPDRAVLQFGKVSSNIFTMDVQWPMTPLQAFAICLSSLDGKLACE